MRLVSLAGIFVILALLFALSRNRSAIPWRLVVVGLLIQAALGAVLLQWDAGRSGLFWFGDRVKEFLDLHKEGSRFIFGPMVDFGLTRGAYASADPEALQAFRHNGRYDEGFLFAFQVLPTVIFFSALMGVLYYLGVMQWIVRGMAVLMAKAMGTSGAESLSACGNIFVGQTEAPLMVRPYLPKMTHSEIHTVMTGGFCTIAGSVFGLYVLFGVPAGYLIVASLMAVPAGLICSKMLVPETGRPETLGRSATIVDKNGSNVVEAAANGALDGLRLALNIAAMLLAFLGLVAVFDWLLSLLPGSVEVLAGGGQRQWLTLDWLLGKVLYPLAMVMGVSGNEVEPLAQLLGKKIVLTELIAYKDLGPQIQAGTLSPRAQMIATFALCGFANLGSVAIQIGGLGAMAPDRKSDIARFAVLAMAAGALATCMTACMAGVLSDGLSGAPK